VPSSRINWCSAALAGAQPDVPYPSLGWLESGVFGRKNQFGGFTLNFVLCIFLLSKTFSLVGSAYRRKQSPNGSGVI
jgi:hypothetical protein